MEEVYDSDAVEADDNGGTVVAEDRLLTLRRQYPTAVVARVRAGLFHISVGSSRFYCCEHAVDQSPLCLPCVMDFANDRACAKATTTEKAVADVVDLCGDEDDESVSIDEERTAAALSERPRTTLQGKDERVADVALALQRRFPQAKVELTKRGTGFAVRDSVSVSARYFCLHGKTKTGCRECVSASLISGLSVGSQVDAKSEDSLQTDKAYVSPHSPQEADDLLCCIEPVVSGSNFCPTVVRPVALNAAERLPIWMRPQRPTSSAVRSGDFDLKELQKRYPDAIVDRLVSGRSSFVVNHGTYKEYLCSHGKRIALCNVCRHAQRETRPAPYGLADLPAWSSSANDLSAHGWRRLNECISWQTSAQLLPQQDQPLCETAVVVLD